MYQNALKTIHPFPARMAPEIALRHLERIPKSAIVLDPMVGSGTTLKIAGMLGCHGIGFDVDPLALLISRVWNTPSDTPSVYRLLYTILPKARQIEPPILPWIDNDKETLDFVRFWFAPDQEQALRRLSGLIFAIEGVEGDILRVALSRIIITKRKGASLGRDISHSRPHKVADENDFDVLENFEKSAIQVCRALEANPGSGIATIQAGDAKQLNALEGQSVDYIVTSPPYLTAVDYFRGHRLSLVWLGYTLSTLRSLRKDSIGLDKHPSKAPDDVLIQQLLAGVEHLAELKRPVQQAIIRYALELHDIAKEFYRVLKPGGQSTIVLADSFSSGKLISSTRVFKNAASKAGLTLLQSEERPILATRRYLPPPANTFGNNMDNRMKTEAIMTFLRP